MSFARSLLGWWQSSGRPRCPRCFADFTAESALWVSDHPGLQRDNVLGAGEWARFERAALRISDRNELVDPMGTPVRRRACPSCRALLVPELLKRRCRVVSIIGAAGSGKSTLLASMLHASKPAFDAAGIGMMPLGDSAGTAWSLGSRLFAGGVGSHALVELPRSLNWPLLVSFSRGSERGVVAFHEIEPESAAAPEMRKLGRSDALVCVVDPARNQHVRDAVEHDLQTRGVDPKEWDRSLRSGDTDGDTDRDAGAILGMAVSELRARGGQSLFGALPPLAMCQTKLDVWEGLLGLLPERQEAPTRDEGWSARFRRAVREATIGVPSANRWDRDAAMSLVPDLVSQVEQQFPAREFFSVQALGTAAVDELMPSGESRIFVRPVDLRPRGADRILYWLLANLFPAFAGHVMGNVATVGDTNDGESTGGKESFDERSQAL